MTNTIIVLSIITGILFFVCIYIFIKITVRIIEEEREIKLNSSKKNSLPNVSKEDVVIDAG